MTSRAVVVALTTCVWFLLSTQTAEALRAADLRDASVAVVNNLFHKSVTNPQPPAPNYLLYIRLNTRDPTNPGLNLLSKCRTGSTGMYTYFPAGRSTDVSYEEMKSEVNGRRSYRMNRYNSRFRYPYVGIASGDCFAALMPEEYGTTYVPDYQVLLAAWMKYWAPPVSYYAVVYATNQPCEYPKADETDPQNYCTRIPEDIIKNRWNRYRRDYSQKLLYIQHLDSTHFVIYDFGSGTEWVLPWEDADELDVLLGKYTTGGHRSK